RLTILAESRIRWKVYVRFGGEYWETYHRNMTRRRVLSLHKVFRYADALLMMAECYFYKENYEKAVEYLDMTRTRANLSKYTFRTPARLEEEIRNERARELFGEFQRKYDLVRWGIWYEAVTDNSDYAYLQLNTANSRIKPCHRYYPIPDTEVTYSKNNLDNNEYKAYGL
uniref:RagB/SusD family nutrient uptake outer membrane protein n=1 Tax=Alistipes shahii TaxID=328814 RepID=UPI003AF41640